MFSTFFPFYLHHDLNQPLNHGRSTRNMFTFKSSIIILFLPNLYLNHSLPFNYDRPFNKLFSASNFCECLIMGNNCPRANFFFFLINSVILLNPNRLQKNIVASTLLLYQILLPCFYASFYRVNI